MAKLLRLVFICVLFTGVCYAGDNRMSFMVSDLPKSVKNMKIPIGEDSFFGIGDEIRREIERLPKDGDLTVTLSDQQYTITDLYFNFNGLDPKRSGWSNVLSVTAGIAGGFIANSQKVCPLYGALSFGVLGYFLTESYQMPDTVGGAFENWKIESLGVGVEKDEDMIFTNIPENAQQNRSALYGGYSKKPFFYSVTLEKVSDSS